MNSTIILFVLFIAVIGVAFFFARGIGRRLIRRVRSNSKVQLRLTDGKVSRQLENLVQLTRSDCHPLPEAAEDWPTILEQCRVNLRGARKYTAMRVDRYVGGSDKDQRFGSLVLRADFVFPDSFHIQKRVLNNTQYAYDEWITIENAIYQKAGGWYRVSEAQKAEWERYFGFLNKTMLIDDALALLEKERITSKIVMSIYGRRYGVIEFDKEKLGSLYYPMPEEEHPLSSSGGRVELWIDLEKCFVVRHSLHTYSSPNLQEYEVVRVFASFNEDIEVMPPEWLNIEENSSGQFIVTDNRIAPMVQFYEG